MKTPRSLFACVLAASALCATEAWAQTVYKCANVYSQQPCPGAVTLNVDDSRTPAQKAQADAVSAQAAKAAAGMQKDRLAQEKLELAKRGNKPMRPAVATKPKVAKGSAKQARKPAPEYFTAAVAPLGKQSKPKRANKAVDAPVADKTDATEKTAQR